jgi:hypothetical protein
VLTQNQSDTKTFILPLSKSSCPLACDHRGHDFLRFGREDPRFRFFVRRFPKYAYGSAP